MMIRRSASSLRGCAKLMNSSSSMVCFRQPTFTKTLVHMNQFNNNTQVRFYTNQYANSQVNEDPAATLKAQLLDTAVNKYVSTLGWTAEALNMAASDLNVSRMSVSQLLNNAEHELIEYFIVRCNQQMSRAIQQTMDTSTMTGPEIVKMAIRMRLEMVAPFILSGKWQDAMGTFIFGKHPLDFVNQVFYHFTSSTNNGGSSNNMSQTSVTGANALYHLAILADEICFLAKQRDTDINWYAQRAAIATIYASTEFYMLTDKSEGFQDTWQFLNRRVEDAFYLKDQTNGLFKDISFWVNNFQTLWGMSGPMDPSPYPQQSTPRPTTTTTATPSPTTTPEKQN